MTPGASSDRRPVAASDLTRLRWPLEPALRPDGRALAYAVSGPSDEFDALAYDVVVDEFGEGWARRPEPRLLRGCRAPKWSPDGARLACVHATGAPGVVMVVGGSGGEPLHVFPGPARDIDWSPDSTRLAVLTPDSIVIVDVATGRRRATAVPAGTRLVRWCPYGDSIAAIGGTDGLDERPLESTLTCIDAESGVAREWLRWRGPLRNAAWSPNGDVLALLGHPRGPTGWEHDGVWLLQPGVGEPHEITAGHDVSFGRAVRGDDERALGLAPLQWTSLGDALLTTVVEGGLSRAVRVSIDGTLGEPAGMGHGAGRAVLELAAATGGDALAYTWSDPWHPGELAVVAEGAQRFATDVGGAWQREVTLAPTIAISARAAEPEVDSDESSTPPLDGWLTLPGDTPAPLVVQVHGGPHHSVGWRFSFDAQRLAALGCAVLRANPRGSTGRGRDFARAIEADWGGPDLRDVLALTEAAAAHPGVDGTRVAIVGESYGGFMAGWAIANSERFAAAIAENAVSDPLELARGPRGPNFWWVEFGASPHDHPDRYRARSVLARADRISTPLLLIHAEDDDNVPIAQSEALHTALSERGGAVRFATIPGEGHMVNVFGRPSRRLARTAAFDAFLVEHLRPRPHLTGGLRHED